MASMCLVVLLGLVVPRLTLFLLWLFDYRGLAGVHPWWLGLLGFLAVPYTTLAYTLLHGASGEVGGVGHMLILAIALLMDTSAWRGTRKKREK